MDGRGGCCIARSTHDMSTMNRIMLRFRPIAPKPTAGGTVSEGSSSESGDAFFKGGRVKRETNTIKKRRTRQRKTVSSPGQKHPVPVVTLPLLPETPDLTLSTEKEVRNNNNYNLKWLSFENRSPAKVEPHRCYCAMDPSAVRMGGFYSCVTVECLTDTWVEGEGLGSTDEERRVKLCRDTCPGFISDGYGRVTWTNGAYREMMGHEGEGLVLLVMKVSAVVPYTSFTCMVRVVQFVCGKERSSLTVPCDVWRMDCGGFAWRLDVKAALSLRLGF